MGKLYRLSAFPKTSNGGNKAGVYIDADNLSDLTMQSIAKDLNFSETAFVLKSDKADFRVRFFTPTSEVNLCGHATIATFNLLKQLDLIKPGIYTQETKAGILKLDVSDEMVFMQQPRPIYDLVLSDVLIKPCFENLECHPTLRPQIVSTGMRELFLPVKNQKILNRLKPQFEHIIELSKTFDLIGIHAFCLDDEVDVYGRNFAPILGIDEESATGTSNGALACYLYHHHRQKETFIMRQGYSMKLPSEIKVKLKIEHNNIKEVWVGGEAIQLS